MRNIDIQFIIDEADYEKSVVALHEALIEEQGAAARDSGAREAA